METLLFIDGVWRPARSGLTIPVLDPATGSVCGAVAQAGSEEVEAAAMGAWSTFEHWRDVPVLERSAILRRAAVLVRERSASIAHALTLENGKPLAQAHDEIEAAAEAIEWFAEEGRRAYGRIIPSRNIAVRQATIRQPIGPVAAFAPWNFPLGQSVKKIAAALAAGCTIVLKGPEETPASIACLVSAFHDAGLPAGALQLLFGVPAEVSAQLIPHPAIRKISFTGSTAVGKLLASLAGQHMKPTTMELGGHAPAIVLDDADIEQAALSIAGGKFYNAGQVCVAPTRVLVQKRHHEHFTGLLVEHAKQLRLGSGFDAETTMGPLTNLRRLEAMERFVADATSKGAQPIAGGARHGNSGYFFAPTILTGCNLDMQAMHEEIFGPICLVASFTDQEEALREANRLDFGLAAYVYTRSSQTAERFGNRLESGMVSINHLGLSLAETPFGGIKDSGHGAEGGIEGLDAYLVTKFVTQKMD